MGVWQTYYSRCRHAVRSQRAGEMSGFVDVDDRCPSCKADPIVQNVPTGLPCPLCGCGLYRMTRRADGRPFLACSGWYDPDRRCRYTRNDAPAAPKTEAAPAADPAQPRLPGMP